MSILLLTVLVYVELSFNVGFKMGCMFIVLIYAFIVLDLNCCEPPRIIEVTWEVVQIE